MEFRAGNKAAEGKNCPVEGQVVGNWDKGQRGGKGPIRGKKMERAKGFEPSTFTLAT
jgi:hypothetical protein